MKKQPFIQTLFFVLLFVCFVVKKNVRLKYFFPVQTGIRHDNSTSHVCRYRFKKRHIALHLIQIPDFSDKKAAREPVPLFLHIHMVLLMLY